MISKSAFLHLFALLCAITVVLVSLEEPEVSAARRARQQKILLPPPENPHLFTFGYHESFADMLWLRVVQDIDICEQAKAPSPAATDAAIPSAPRCERGWVYRMLKAVTDLAPQFRMPYASGAVVLSVLVDDREGAREIFERGVRRFPKDWSIAYRAAYHYLYEHNDPIRAAELLAQAGRHGAPNWVHSLAGRLLTEQGRAEMAKPILEEALARQPNGVGAPKIRLRLEEVNRILARKAAEKTGADAK